MKQSELDAILKGLAPGMKAIIDGIAPAIARAICDETQALQHRIHVLESKCLKYQGTYQRVQVYNKGDAVTHNGGMWYATRDDVTDAPGVGTAWQLTAKTRT